MGSIRWNEPALRRACTKDPQLCQPLDEAARSIADRANSMSSGFKTEQTVRWETGEKVGGKRPEYKAVKAEVRKKGPVALVVTGNYAAQKDTLENNTLLKAKG